MKMQYNILDLDSATKETLVNIRDQILKEGSL